MAAIVGIVIVVWVNWISWLGKIEMENYESIHLIVIILKTTMTTLILFPISPNNHPNSLSQWEWHWAIHVVFPIFLLIRFQVFFACNLACLSSVKLCRCYEENHVGRIQWIKLHATIRFHKSAVYFMLSNDKKHWADLYVQFDAFIESNEIVDTWNVSIVVHSVAYRHVLFQLHGNICCLNSWKTVAKI